MPSIPYPPETPTPSARFLLLVLFAVPAVIAAARAVFRASSISRSFTALSLRSRKSPPPRPRPIPARPFGQPSHRPSKPSRPAMPPRATSRSPNRLVDSKFDDVVAVRVAVVSDDVVVAVVPDAPGEDPASASRKTSSLRLVEKGCAVVGRPPRLGVRLGTEVGGAVVDADAEAADARDGDRNGELIVVGTDGSASGENKSRARTSLLFRVTRATTSSGARNPASV
mmetsp:Transcript_13876/g.45910  ORF Transcript_13876/g.45910 Transcript_13876/m.45910 type:complete len:226 (-) Transcript_13876:2637-3314(-)